MAKVLVVDDELSLLWLLEQVIEDQGHTVFKAGNGKQALQIIEQQVPALVISDVMMPLMDGYTLLEQIRLNPKTQDLKVVLVSAAPINRNGPYKANEYFSKPYDLEAIEAMLERILS